MSSTDRLGQIVLGHITDIAHSRCSITDADVAAEQDPTLSQILAGLLTLAEELAYADQERAEIERLNRELSTPVLELGRQVSLLPLVGVVDPGRLEQLVERALAAVSSRGARVLVIDVTGVATIDAGVAAHLSATIRAVRLLGARTIITGINPAHAQRLVALDVGFDDVLTRRTLGDGLETAFAMTRA